MCERHYDSLSSLYIFEEGMLHLTFCFFPFVTRVVLVNDDIPGGVHQVPGVIS